MPYHPYYRQIRWPFRIGEAVYWWPHTASLNARQLYHAGVVVLVNGPAITLWLHDGRRRTVAAPCLVYRGYCSACQVPAVERLGLRCPRCTEAAEPVPPPAELVVRWFHHGHTHNSLWLREMVLRGCTFTEARRWVYEIERTPRAVSIPIAALGRAA